MANLAAIEAIQFQHLSGWQATEFLGPPSGALGGPRPVLLIAPTRLLEVAAGQYGAIRPGFAGTIRAVFGRVKEDGVGAVADITLQPRINGVALTGGALQVLVASAVSGRYLLGTVVTAANVFDFDDEIEINKTTTTAFTDGEVEVVLLVEPK